MVKKKLKKSQKTIILGNVGKFVGLGIATVGMIAGFMLLSSVLPLSIGLLVGGLLLGTASIAFGVDMEAKSNRESEKEAMDKRAKKYTVSNFEMEKQEEKTNVVDNEQSNLSVENQKEIEHSDELTLTK